MRKLWIKFRLWWEGYCFKHGIFRDTNMFGLGCFYCLHADHLRREAKQFAADQKIRARRDKLCDYVEELDREKS